MNPATEVWEKVAALMQADMTTTTWNTWFDDATAVSLEALCRACGTDHVDVLDTTLEPERFKNLVRERLNSNDLSVIIARRPCILQMKKMAKFAKKKI